MTNKNSCFFLMPINLNVLKRIIDCAENVDDIA